MLKLFFVLCTGAMRSLGFCKSFPASPPVQVAPKHRIQVFTAQQEHNAQAQLKQMARVLQNSVGSLALNFEKSVSEGKQEGRCGELRGERSFLITQNFELRSSRERYRTTATKRWKTRQPESPP